MTVPPLSLSSMPDIDFASFGEAAPGPSFESTMQDFEGIFVSMMLKEMRKTVGEGFFGGDKADAIGGLFDMTLGEEIGRHGGLGITAALSRYRDVAGSTDTSPSTDTNGLELAAGETK